MTPRIPTELRALRELFHACDPAPDSVVRAAYAAGRPGSVGAGTALELVSDSAEAPTRVRAGRGRGRALTFVMPGRIIEMDVTPGAPGVVQARGMVISRAGQGVPDGELVVRYPDGQRAARLDEHGAFRVTDVPYGPVSITFRPERATPAIADWLVW